MTVVQLLQQLSPFLGGFLAVWLASRFSAVRSHEDKVWLRKSEAYGHILEALADIRDWYAVNLDDEAGGREPMAEIAEKRQEQFSTARRRLAATISREVWLLPDSIKQETDRLNRALSERHESWFEHLDSCKFETKKAQELIEKLARGDLKRPSFLSVR